MVTSLRIPQNCTAFLSGLDAWYRCLWTVNILLVKIIPSWNEVSWFNTVLRSTQYNLCLLSRLPMIGVDWNEMAVGVVDSIWWLQVLIIVLFQPRSLVSKVSVFYRLGPVIVAVVAWILWGDFVEIYRYFSWCSCYSAIVCSLFSLY